LQDEAIGLSAAFAIKAGNADKLDGLTVEKSRKSGQEFIRLAL
jgi:hypothetical protein